MQLKRSTLQDIPAIMTIIDDAKELLASLHIDQWQNGYPNAEQVENDIKNNESYVVVNDDNIVMATSMFTFKKEPTYKEVIDGNWLVDEDKVYGVIHRMAIKKSLEN
ncbi:hypothetical protein OEG92_10150 [Polaribacter sejongensis]|uniref:hypothetical protein n=1 Tax=Polaribacter sejongensis TaxID=985043 RepID=UPI0035A6DC43